MRRSWHLNDSPNAPRAVLSVNDPGFTFNNSDYLVIKSARVGMSDAAGKWTTLTQANLKRSWTPNSENLVGDDYVIVLAVGSTDANRRSLVTSGTFYTQYTTAGTSGFVPVEPYSANIVYGSTTCRRRARSIARSITSTTRRCRSAAPRTPVSW